MKIGLIVFIAALILAHFPSIAGVRSDKISLDEIYDHDLHEEKVFKGLKVKCSQCHNFKVTAPDKIGKFLPGLDAQTFNRPLKQICHECHQGSNDRFKAAPKACYTCHNGIEKLKSIKPMNHHTVNWKKHHGLMAKTNPRSCVQCHSNNECVKCHAQRNTVKQKNHRRNYRYYHSIDAHMSPQKCQVCHSKSECSDCHLGRVK